MSDSVPFDHGSVRRRLLAWFARNSRDLPWRHDRDPYRIWVSEIMLQQTQVATVIPYFKRFLASFPTVADLARASLQDVLRLWEGLGYYRRARHLHEAARLLLEHHDGRLPRDPDELRRLPGFGPYTTNAVLSQAFEARLPILEANSQRLLCRLFAERGDPASPVLKKRLWQHAEEMLPTRKIGDFNQALMELGALVCTPDSPRCDVCPLSAHCHAHRLGLTHILPAKPRPPRIEEVREIAVVVRRKTDVLLVQRPAQGRWADLWEFPRMVLDPAQDTGTVTLDLLRGLGLEVELGDELATIRHGVTRFRITLVCREARHRRGRFRAGLYQDAVWIPPSRLAEYPLSRPQRRLAQVVQPG